MTLLQIKRKVRGFKGKELSAYLISLAAQYSRVATGDSKEDSGGSGRQIRKS